MSDIDEKHYADDERKGTLAYVVDAEEEKRFENEMDVTADELTELEKHISGLSLEETFPIVKHIYDMHEHDHNFSSDVIWRMEEFLKNKDAIMADPVAHQAIIEEMKLEAVLVLDNSPYPQVRAVVSLEDDMDMPSLTFRVWVLGTLFLGIACCVNALFNQRQPEIDIGAITIQIVTYPCGRLMERLLPDWGFTFRGVRHTINPGPFNRKEHMLIAILTGCALGAPYTINLVLVQALPRFFNEAWAKGFGYQITLALAMNLGGCGLAGLARRFLVYPSYCVWPKTITTIALNNAFHTGRGDDPVPGPRKKVYRWSRLKFFWVAFGCMWVYFWFPNFIFRALGTFNWINWIAPNNVNLSLITGMRNGLGMSPWTTWDYNVMIKHGDPLTLPAFTIFNHMGFMFFNAFIIIAIYWTNTWNSAYLPIGSNATYDNTGALYKVQKILDDKGMFNAAKYQTYSQPRMTAANAQGFIWFMAKYTGVITWVALFHSYQLKYTMKNAWNDIKAKFSKKPVERDFPEDVHSRLMRKYPDAPDWWYLILLIAAIAIALAGVAAWPTNTSPGVVIFGYAISLFFMVPSGMVSAVTGTEVTLNVISEIIGGGVAPGNAIAMSFFKSFGVDTLTQALRFTSDLKMAHYVKINQRHTFIVQVWAMTISSFIFTALLTFVMTFEGFCTDDAKWSLTCPDINNFFTASVFWGTIGARRMFNIKGLYPILLIGLPIGVIVPILLWLAIRRWPRSRWLRQVHPIVMFHAGTLWTPYNLAYGVGAVPIAAISWLYVKKRYLAFWSKYNFVLAAALSGGIAISAFIQFWAVSYPGFDIVWWGNTVSRQGCEKKACTLLTKKDYPGGKAYFGPDPGTFYV